jgi:hypothetical protein
MRLSASLLLFLLLCAPTADAQRASPSGAHVHRGTAMRWDATLDSTSFRGARVHPGTATRGHVALDSTAFRGERVIIGAALGAIVVAPLGGLMAAGACERPDCNGWQGARYGAAVGAVLGGIFGLIMALPPRGS